MPEILHAHSPKTSRIFSATEFVGIVLISITVRYYKTGSANYLLKRVPWVLSVALYGLRQRYMFGSSLVDIRDKQDLYCSIPNEKKIIQCLTGP